MVHIHKPFLVLAIATLLLITMPLSAQDVAQFSDEEVVSARWLAMAEFYADNGLLTDDPDAVMAARWVAMGKFYQAHDMLIWQEADYAEAAECQQLRWQAMAEFYASHNLLTRMLDDL